MITLEVAVNHIGAALAHKPQTGWAVPLGWLINMLEAPHVHAPPVICWSMICSESWYFQFFP